MASASSLTVIVSSVLFPYHQGSGLHLSVRTPPPADTLLAKRGPKVLYYVHQILCLSKRFLSCRKSFISEVQGDREQRAL